MGFPRQEFWSGFPFPSPGDLSNPGIKPLSPAFAGSFFTTEPTRKPHLFLLLLTLTETFSEQKPSPHQNRDIRKRITCHMTSSIPLFVPSFNWSGWSSQGYFFTPSFVTPFSKVLLSTAYPKLVNASLPVTSRDICNLSLFCHWKKGKHCLPRQEVPSSIWMLS